MGFLDSIGSRLSNVVSSIPNNLGNLALLGLGGYGMYQQHRAGQQAQRNMEAQALAQAEAAMEAEGSQNEALGAAQEALMAQYEMALQMLAPYIEAGKQVLGPKKKTFLVGLKNLNNLSNQTITPENLAKANSSAPSWQVGLPLLNSVVANRKQNG